MHMRNARGHHHYRRAQCQGHQLCTATIPFVLCLAFSSFVLCVDMLCAYASVRECVSLYVGVARCMRVCS